MTGETAASLPQQPLPGEAFRARTAFAALDRLLARLRANKADLLMVLEKPLIPLHLAGATIIEPLDHHVRARHRTA